MIGKFIVLEGVEGVGKTTQAKILCDRLNAEGYHTIISREPGGVALAEKIRELLLSPNYEPDTLTEVLLFTAARNEHLQKVVIPALCSGTNVICDRYTYSTMAYQGYGAGASKELIRQLNDACVLSPNIALFLDLPPEKGFARKGGFDIADRIEQLGTEYFDRVYEGFVTMCNDGELVRVDVDRDIDTIAEDIYNKVVPLLSQQ